MKQTSLNQTYQTWKHHS